MENLHEKINKKARIYIPSHVTVLMDGIFYTVNIAGKEIKYYICCNQKGVPKDAIEVFVMSVLNSLSANPFKYLALYSGVSEP